jgi:drug/metabolite transporter (DMT)-like permease
MITFLLTYLYAMLVVMAAVALFVEYRIRGRGPAWHYLLLTAAALGALYCLLLLYADKNDGKWEETTTEQRLERQQ